MRITLRAPAATARRALIWIAPLVLAALPGRVDAQAGKVSPTGEYKASLSCAGGVATEPGPNGANYTSAGLSVYDSERKGPPGPVVTCGSSADLGSSELVLVTWNIFVFDKSHTLVKQCGNEPFTPIKGERFTCKAGGNVSATLTIRPR